MSYMTKAAERYHLTMQTGKLFTPLDDLAERSTAPAPVDYSIAAARFQGDLSRWMSEVEHFVSVGGVRFGHQYDQIRRITRDFHRSLVYGSSNLSLEHEPAVINQDLLRDELSRIKASIASIIDQVPIAWEARLFSEKTPLDAHFHIRDAINTARVRVHYFDRYLHSDFFPLYLRGLDRSIEVRLVTTHGNTGKSPYGVAHVLPVSQLAAQEFTNYRLIECGPSDLHDRNLRVDNNVFHLGPSINSAGKCPTNFTPGESTAQAHGVLDNIIRGGMVVT